MELHRRRIPETSSPAPQLNVRTLSPELRSAFAEVGLDDTRLRSFAGRDEVIRGGELTSLYRELHARTGSAAGARGGDLGRSERLYALLDRELTAARPRPGAPTPGAPTPGAGEARPAAGLRPGQASGAAPARVEHHGHDHHGHDHDVHRSGGAARLGIQYAAPLRPEARLEEAAPAEPNWFIKLLETLFCWIPGVSTDDDRLREFGQRLADDHETEIVAFREAYAAERGRETRSNGLPPSAREIEAESRRMMIDQLATRMQAQGVSADGAQARAAVAVDAMLARVDANREASGARAAELGIPAPTSEEARTAAATAVSAQRTAAALGGPWSERVQRAGRVPGDDHPMVAAQRTPEHRERAKAWVVRENLRAVSGLMALERSGQLQLPPSAVDGLLGAHGRGLIGSQAVAGAASALSRLPEGERTSLVQALDRVPEDRRAFAYAALAREHVALASSSTAEAEGARARVQSAAAQLAQLSPADAERALRRGTLGLDGPRILQLQYGTGAQQRTLDVPVYFHPTLTQAERDRHFELIREAYGHVPHGLMRHVIAAEGGEDFNVQALPNGSLHSGTTEPERPEGLSDTGAFYRTQDNQIRLNVSVLDDIIRRDPQSGRARAVGMILHETVHDLDDMADPDQNLGFFISGQPDAARDRARTTGDGELAPAWAHYAAVASRFEDASTDVVHSRDARRYRELGRNERRTPAEDIEYTRLGESLARRSGAMTPYSAHSGVAHRGGQLGEWWAETYSSYLNPATRDELRRADPVAHAAARHYTELMEQGVPATEALRTALRFSLSSQVAAQQGVRMLEGTPRAGDLPAAQLASLEAIGDGFTQHARALDGWSARDAGLRTMRGREAGGAVEEGRRLIEAVETRLAHLARSGRGGGDEHRRLQALARRLETSVRDLEAHQRRLAPERRSGT